MSGGGAEVGIHGGVGGAVSEDDHLIGEPDVVTGGDDGVGYMGQVIYIYPYVPLTGLLLLVWGSNCPLNRKSEGVFKGIG